MTPLMEISGVVMAAAIMCAVRPTMAGGDHSAMIQKAMPSGVVSSPELSKAGTSLSGDAADDGCALMERVQEEARASSEIIEVAMTLIDSSGTTRTRRATIYQKLRGPRRMARLIRFHSPPELAGSAVLALENTDRENDWWIYVPAYHVTRRIPSVNRSETFMGTDLSYEDLTDLRVDEYAFRLSGVDTIDGAACQVLEAVPLDPRAGSGSQYWRLLYWVDLSKPLYPKVLLHGHDGDVIKEIRNSRAVHVDGRWRWERMEVHDLRTGHRTAVETRARRIGESLPDRMFTERALRRAG